MRARALHQNRSTSQRALGSGDGFSQALGLVLGPVILGLIGRGVDGLLGITPILTVAFVVLGVIGSVAAAYYRYIADMDQLDVGKPWANSTESLA